LTVNETAESEFSLHVSSSSSPSNWFGFISSKSSAVVAVVSSSSRSSMTRSVSLFAALNSRSVVHSWLGLNLGSGDELGSTFCEYELETGEFVDESICSV
jgi:hypothetical protein